MITVLFIRTDRLSCINIRVIIIINNSGLLLALVLSFFFVLFCYFLDLVTITNQRRQEDKNPLIELFLPYFDRASQLQMPLFN